MAALQILNAVLRLQGCETPVCRYNAGVADINNVEYRNDQGMVIDFHEYNRNWQFGLAYMYLIPHLDK
jgi:hypothetical protein